MFARFRNLFSKTKTQSEAVTETNISSTHSNDNEDVSASNLEGFDFLKSVVENEQPGKTAKSATVTPSSLSDEVNELLTKRILNNNETSENLSSSSFINGAHEVLHDAREDRKISEEPILHKNISLEGIRDKNDTYNRHSIKSFEELPNNTKPNHSLKVLKREEIGIPFAQNDKNKQVLSNLILPEFDVKNLQIFENKSELNSEYENIPQISNIENIIEINKGHEQLLEKKVSTQASPSDHYPNIQSYSENSTPQLSDNSQSLPQFSNTETCASSSASTSLKKDLTDINLCNNSSIVVEDSPPSAITTPSPTVDIVISGGGSSSNTSTLESSSSSREIFDTSKIIVNPIENNVLACQFITNKLGDIAEVAESLDAVIRDVQENVQSVEVDSHPSPRHKKLDTLRSTSSEDWHSRSTEDDSFATASEGNFTPSSASFQTASGRTSSYISCDKNSFDASEADDSAYAFEMPELTSPLNMSFEGSEQSFLSAQAPHGDLLVHDKMQTPNNLMANTSKSNHFTDEDVNSIAEIEDLHSGSVTPTPEEKYAGYMAEGIPVESESEFAVAYIADAPSTEILTEHRTMPMSRTPEVRRSTSNICSNQNPITTQLTVNVAIDSNDEQQQHDNINATTNHNNNNNNTNNNKPNAAWRRSKYYENITKQTIKGFL